jgi:hypothetical protein
MAVMEALIDWVRNYWVWVVGPVVVLVGLRLGWELLAEQAEMLGEWIDELVARPRKPRPPTGRAAP